MEVKERLIKLLELSDGSLPFTEWVNTLDKATKARVVRRVGRLRLGHFGDWKSVGEEVFELRLDLGPGYRVYYAQHGQEIIVLLGGGDKKTQHKDIKEAQRLWKECKNEITRFQRDFT